MEKRTLEIIDGDNVTQLLRELKKNRVVLEVNGKACVIDNSRFIYEKMRSCLNVHNERKASQSQSIMHDFSLIKLDVISSESSFYVRDGSIRSINNLGERRGIESYHIYVFDIYNTEHIASAFDHIYQEAVKMYLTANVEAYVNE